MSNAHLMKQHSAFEHSALASTRSVFNVTMRHTKVTLKTIFSSEEKALFCWLSERFEHEQKFPGVGHDFEADIGREAELVLPPVSVLVQ